MDTFNTVINRLSSELTGKGFDCITVLQWCSMWNEAGVMGLSTKDRVQMDIYHEAIAAMVYKGEEFNSYPKDALQPTSEVSLILKGVVKDYPPDHPPAGVVQAQCGALWSAVDHQLRHLQQLRCHS